MRDQLLLLFELNEIDAKVKALQARFDEIPVKANQVKRDLDKLSAELQSSQQRHEESTRERRRVESEVSGERDKLRKWEARLNDIRNSREFAALQREVEGLKRQIRTLEDETLQHMQAQEDAAASATQLQAQVQTLAAEHQELEGDAQARMKEVRDQIDELTSGRDAIIARLRPNLMKQYEYLHKRIGLALAVVHGGTCLACHMQLPPQLYNELQRGDTIELCPMCHRILFWEQFAERKSEEQSGVQA